MLMVLTPEDVSKVRFGGSLTPQSVETLRLLRDAFGVVFKLKADVESLQQQQAQQRQFFEAKRRKRILGERDGTKEGEEDGSGEQEPLFNEAVIDREPTILVSCLGIGYSNINRRVT